MPAIHSVLAEKAGLKWADFVSSSSWAAPGGLIGRIPKGWLWWQQGGYGRLVPQADWAPWRSLNEMIWMVSLSRWGWKGFKICRQKFCASNGKCSYAIMCYGSDVIVSHTVCSLPKQTIHGSNIHHSDYCWTDWWTMRGNNPPLAKQTRLATFRLYKMLVTSLSLRLKR